MDVFWILKFIVFVFIAGTVVQRFLDKLWKRLPGPIGVPVIGRLPWIIFNTIFYHHGNFFEAMTNDGMSYGDARFYRIGMREFVILSSSDSIQEAFVKQGDDFLDRPTADFYTTHRQVEVSQNGRKKKVDGGILFSNDDLWKEHRRFALRVLRDFGMGKNLAETNIQLEIKGLTDHLSSRSSEAFNPNMCLTKAVSNIISQLVFGVRLGYEDPDIERQITVMKEYTQYASFAQFFPLFFPCFENKYYFKVASVNRILDLDKQLLDYMSAKIERVESNFRDGTEPTNYIEAYLSECKRLEALDADVSHFNRNQLVVTVADLFLAGTDTTSNALNWAFIYMSKFKDWQQKVHEELDQELGSCAEVSFIDRLRCPVIQAVLDEVMRHCSLVPHGGDRGTRKETWFRGCRISPNTYIFADTKCANYDKSVWPEPHRFDPARFLNDKGTYEPSKNLVTFSVGKRSCLGESLARMEFFMFFSSVMLKFEVDVDEETENKGEEVFRGTEGSIHAPKEHQLIFRHRF